MQDYIFLNIYIEIALVNYLNPKYEGLAVL